MKGTLVLRPFSISLDDFVEFYTVLLKCIRNYGIRFFSPGKKKVPKTVITRMSGKDTGNLKQRKKHRLPSIKYKFENEI